MVFRKAVFQKLSHWRRDNELLKKLCRTRLNIQYSHLTFDEREEKLKEMNKLFITMQSQVIQQGYQN